jgi:hypothetical protein
MQTGRRMRRQALLLLALATSGCGGNYSNDDVEFLVALPTKDALTVRVPAQSQALGTDASFHKLTVETAESVNAGLAQMLNLVDLIKALPPTQRLPDARLWGPWPDDQSPGFEVEFVLTRETDHFKYAFQERRKGVGDFVPLIEGTYFTDTAHTGHGTLDVHFKAANTLKGVTDLGTANLLEGEVVYVNDVNPRSVKTQLSSLDGNGNPASISYEYLEHPDHSGELLYEATADFANNGGAPEHLHVWAQWTASGAGRADARADKGAFDTAQFDRDVFTQCWDSTFGEVYFDSELQKSGVNVAPGIGCSTDGRTKCPVGDLSSCVLPGKTP